VPKNSSDSAVPSTNRWADNQTRDPLRQRVQVFHARHQEGSSFGCTATLGVRGFEFSALGRQEGSSFGCAATLGGRGFEFSARGARRVRILAAPRPWTSEGSSFPCGGARRVQVLGAPRPWTSEGSSFPRGRTGGFKFWARRDPGRQRVGVFCAGGQEGSSFGCTATLGVRGFKFSVLGTRRVQVLGVPRAWASEGSNFPHGSPENS